MSQSQRYSIRKQLLLWLLIPILILLGLSIGSNYYLSRSFINTAYDDGLEELARMLAGQVELEKEGRFEMASPVLTKKIMEDQSVDGLYYLILGPSNQFIAGDRRLGTSASKGLGPQYRNVKLDGRTVRIVTIRMPFETAQKPLWVSVQLGETLEDRGDLIGKILITTIAHQLILILLATACVWFGVTRGLQPLARICQAIQSRSPADLNILNLEQIPDEVQPLISAINDLLSKINSYLGMQRRFLANAAHQLRTPMAGLQTQVELLIRQELPDSAQHTLTQIQTGLNRSTHLLHQMLSLSRAEPDALKIAQFKPVNLTRLVPQVSETFVSAALRKNIDFGIEAGEEPIEVLGDENSLHDLISNLIDNALLYTPGGGKVTVRLFKEAQVVFSVEDSGCGIPTNEREKVFERFYRLEPNQTLGSGLGLSIVQEIATAHHMQIHLQEGADGIGTLVTVHFDNER
jgi:two-component system sensor histidine kinase TctE